MPYLENRTIVVLPVVGRSARGGHIAMCPYK